MTDVQSSVSDGIGHVQLNRPRAINALNHAMVNHISEQLRHWRDESSVRLVLLDGAGERGLCAGGDIRSIYDDARNGGTESLRFWADEYRMNAQIASYPKPVVAIMDGLVMGGGVGVSAHASHRIVTERSKIAMPEVGIGFVPDVGGTFLLSRSPGELGTHAALTTAQLGGADAILCGLADHFVPSDQVPELVRALATTDVDDAIATVATTPPPGALAGERSWIDRCYDADTVEEILDNLSRAGESAAAAAVEIARKSPVSVKVALRSLRTARTFDDLETALCQEYRVSAAALASTEFVEGIRAQIIDKDRNPQWQPSTIAQVSDSLVDQYFRTPATGDLELTEAQR